MIPRNRIKQYRKAAGESQKELSEVLKVSQAAVGHWEKGIRAPHDSTKVKIAEHYGVPIEKIFFVENSTKSGE